MTESIWSYFDKLGDDDERQAICRLCSNIYCYKTTIYNLKHHLINKHKDDLTVKPDSLVNLVHKKVRKTEDSDSLVKVKKEDSFDKCKKLRSPVWKYFQNDSDRSAICNFCSKILSYKTTITNLRTHLKNKHFEAYEDLSQNTALIKTEVEEANSDGERFEEEYLEIDDEDNVEGNFLQEGDDEVWNYFERETGGRTRCVVCRCSLPNEVATLRSHLKRKHPKLIDARQQVSDETDGAKVFLDVGDEEIFTEVIEQPRQKTSCKTSPKKMKRLHKDSSSADEYVSKIKNNGRDEEIDVFLKYLGNLLKDIPNDLFTKLQCNIINMIMKTKISHESSKNEVRYEQKTNYYLVSNKMPVTEAVNNMDISNKIVIQVPAISHNEIPSSSDVTHDIETLLPDTTPQLVTENIGKNNDDNRIIDQGQTVNLNEHDWTVSQNHTQHDAQMISEDSVMGNEILNAPVSREPPVVLRNMRSITGKKYPDFTPP